MLASSKDPYGVGFREVEIVEEDASYFGMSSSGTDRRAEWREYGKRIKGTEVYERHKERSRIRSEKLRRMGHNLGEEWRKQNRLRYNEHRRKYNKESGRYKKMCARNGKLESKITKESGYKNLKAYLHYRGIHPPLNFVSAYADRPWLKKGQWAWTFAHP